MDRHAGGRVRGVLESGLFDRPARAAVFDLPELHPARRPDAGRFDVVVGHVDQARIGVERYVQVPVRIVLVADRRRPGPLDLPAVRVVGAGIDPALRTRAEFFDQDLSDAVGVHDMLAAVRPRFDRLDFPVIVVLAVRAAVYPNV